MTVLCLTIFGFLLVQQAFTQVPTLPAPDGKFHVHSLPIGQGDANVIQCPSGDLAIFDWGSSNSLSSQFWAAPELRQYLAGSMDRIINIVATHQHADHYDLLPDTFPNLAEVPNLQNIYISCTFADTATTFSDWINAIGANSLIRTFNNGGQCGPLGPACEQIDLCPNDATVITEILAANVGQHCTDGGNKNVDCIVAKITYGDFSILIAGDFEDEGTSDSEDGPQRWMVDFYGPQMEVTVSHIAHHGAETNANKPHWVNTIRARMVYCSGDAWYSYGHPRCGAVEAYRAWLCEPLETDPASPNYCGPTLSSPQLQQTYTCGNSSTTFFQVDNNTKGIYTNTPLETEMHIIDIQTDGVAWNIFYSVTPATP